MPMDEARQGAGAIRETAGKTGKEPTKVKLGDKASVTVPDSGRKVEEKHRANGYRCDELSRETPKPPAQF